MLTLLSCDKHTTESVLYSSCQFNMTLFQIKGYLLLKRHWYYINNGTHFLLNHYINVKELIYTVFYGRYVYAGI